jgi:hypothetical protein
MLKKLAKRLVSELRMSPRDVDELTLDDVIWWLTD